LFFVNIIFSFVVFRIFFHFILLRVFLSLWGTLTIFASFGGTLP